MTSDLKEVPDIEKNHYKAQSQWLWEQLVAGALHPDLVKLILRPSKKGYYDDIPVIAEEGNGVLACVVSCHALVRRPGRQVCTC